MSFVRKKFGFVTDQHAELEGQTVLPSRVNDLDFGYLRGTEKRDSEVSIGDGDSRARW